jgi:hypothetical protein
MESAFHFLLALYLILLGISAYELIVLIHRLPSAYDPHLLVAPFMQSCTWRADDGNQRKGVLRAIREPLQ